MNNTTSPLRGLKVLDLTHRLPGPLASKYLADLGAEVTKVEDSVLKDPFLDGFFAQFDPSFSSWYDELNKAKKVLRLQLNSLEGLEKLKAELATHDVILMAYGEKSKTQYGLHPAALNSLGAVVMELKASEIGSQNQHDLNILATSGFLKLHLASVNPAQSPYVAPPFLPVAGAAFAQRVALQTLALVWQQKQRQKEGITSTLHQICYLDEAFMDSFGPLWGHALQKRGQTKFLHNGAYPCYCIYQTKEGNWLAVAAVEEKFWKQWVTLLNLTLDAGERFNQTPRVFNLLSDSIKQKTAAEWLAILKDLDICVSVVS